MSQQNAPSLAFDLKDQNEFSDQLAISITNEAIRLNPEYAARTNRENVKKELRERK